MKEQDLLDGLNRTVESLLAAAERMKCQRDIYKALAKCGLALTANDADASKAARELIDALKADLP